MLKRRVIWILNRPTIEKDKVMLNFEEDLFTLNYYSL
jgi:hypothetical protein